MKPDPWKNRSGQQTPHFAHLEEEASQRRRRHRRMAGIITALVIVLLGLLLTLWILTAYLTYLPGFAVLAGVSVVLFFAVTAWVTYRLIRGATPDDATPSRSSLFQMGWNWAFNYIMITLRGEQPFVEPVAKQTEQNRSSGFAAILTDEMKISRQGARIEGDHWHAYMEELNQASAAYQRQLQEDEEQRPQPLSKPSIREPITPPPHAPTTDASAPAQRVQDSQPTPVDQEPITEPVERDEPLPEWMQQREKRWESQLDTSQQAYEEEIDQIYAAQKPLVKPAAQKPAQPAEETPDPQSRIQELMPHAWQQHQQQFTDEQSPTSEPPADPEPSDDPTDKSAKK
uniref:Uncharacterized protein n=1 Tax=Magnetococcus massalia (strain MO-1) TaxID=451514 RepID=A0A1S7LMF2_MAGMO|nr:Conserved protein of unknown function [Candidatus Magnetococcus massalia]